MIRDLSKSNFNSEARAGRAAAGRGVSWPGTACGRLPRVWREGGGGEQDEWAARLRGGFLHLEGPKICPCL